MKIYTKFGDKGQTSLFGGSVVTKDDPRVEAYGSIDELNAFLGTVISFTEIDEIKNSLTKIQNDLFVIGSELASPKNKTVFLSAVRIIDLEKEIDSIEPQLAPLKNFILPGGNKTASLLHLARTVCRRAERRIIEFSKIEQTKDEQINPDIIIYINRLSDLLFVQARLVNHRKKIDEVLWKG